VTLLRPEKKPSYTKFELTSLVARLSGIKSVHTIQEWARACKWKYSTCWKDDAEG
jgi:hypothetical protein